MLPLRIEVGSDADFSKLCPPAGSRIAFDQIPTPLQNNLLGFLRHYLGQEILVREGTNGLPLNTLVDNTEVHPDDLRGPKDLLCSLFQAAWWAAWVHQLDISNTCVICKGTVMQHRCNNADCATHTMTNDILGPVEHELKRTGTDG